MHFHVYIPRFDSLEIIEGKSDMDNMPLHSMQQVLWTFIHISIEEAILIDCLKYLPETDDVYDTTHNLLNLPSTDDNPLSYVWLKIHRTRIQN